MSLFASTLKEGDSMQYMVKYQVFISSTYSDLKEERKAILDTLLMADCIPAGMENFVAQDEEQFEVIKKVIDLCDYYVLIIAGRYGSINHKTGISYTEMEYNYAIEKHIPVLVFAAEGETGIIESNEPDDKKEKLKQFRDRVMKNRLASTWKNQSDLAAKVSIAIMKAQKEMNRPGWRRGSENGNYICEAQQNNRRNDFLIDNESQKQLQTHFYGAEITLHFTEARMTFYGKEELDKVTITTTLDSLFKFISLSLTGINHIQSFVDSISNYKEGYYVKKQDALVVKNKYEQLKLLSSHLSAEGYEVVELTDLGRVIMNKLNSLESNNMEKEQNV